MFQKFLITALLVCGIFSFSGCQKIYRMIQKEGAEELELIGEIRLHERNEKVASVQTRLNLFGYGVGSADGILGTNTRNAIERFQHDNGLKTSRFIDYATWKQLMIFDEYGLIMNDEINLYMVQVALKNAGHDVGSVDGKFGRRSMEMLKRFQQSEKLTPDGKIGLKTLNALLRYLPLANAG